VSRSAVGGAGASAAAAAAPSVVAPVLAMVFVQVVFGA
jgi:drug/metabolite transporter (DMT)-like permease